MTTMQLEATGEPEFNLANPDPRRWRALGVIAISQLMVVLDGSIVNLALPSAKRALDISDANQQWVLTAYTLTFGGLLLLGGRIADYLGRKRMFMIGLSGFALASALGGIAPTAGTLYAARGLQRVFAAMLAPAALSLVTVTFHDPKERARAFGVYGAISGGGAAIGLLLGGVLTEYLSWRWCLFINTLIAVVTVLLAIGNIRESKATRTGGLDIPGALTVTLGLIALVYGFTKAAPHGAGDSSHWGEPVTLMWFAAAVVLLAAFFVIETRTANPLLPMRVLLERNRGGSYLVMLIVGIGMFAMFLFLGLYLQVVLGYSPVRAGFAFLPFSGGIIIGAGVAAQLLPRIGPKPLAIPGLILAALGMLWAHPADGRHALHDARPPGDGHHELRSRVRVHPDLLNRTARCRWPGRGCRQRADQHLPAGRRLARNRVAEHGRSDRHRDVHRRPCSRWQGRGFRRPGPWLHPGLLVRGRVHAGGRSGRALHAHHRQGRDS